MAGVGLLALCRKKTDEKRGAGRRRRAPYSKHQMTLGGRNITRSKSDLPPPSMLFWAKFALRDSPPSKEIEKDGMLLTKEGRCLCDRVGDSLVDRRGSKPHVRQPALCFGINLVPAREKKLSEERLLSWNGWKGKHGADVTRAASATFFLPSVCHVAHESPIVFQDCSHEA